MNKSESWGKVLEFSGWGYSGSNGANDICSQANHNFLLERHALVDTMSSFLCSWSSLASSQQAEGPPVAAVGVSLSGGVDSMVIARLLVGLSKISISRIPRTKGQKLSKSEKAHDRLQRVHGMHAGMKVVAIHIDYCNRAESKIEAEFVRHWCESYGIECCIREMPVTRPYGNIEAGAHERETANTPGKPQSNSRQEYEQMTRALRFQAYQEIVSEFGV